MNSYAKSVGGKGSIAFTVAAPPSLSDHWRLHHPADPQAKREVEMMLGKQAVAAGLMTEDGFCTNDRRY